MASLRWDRPLGASKNGALTLAASTNPIEPAAAWRVEELEFERRHSPRYGLLRRMFSVLRTFDSSRPPPRRRLTGSPWIDDVVYGLSEMHA